MSFKRDGDDLDMLRRLKVVYLCSGIDKLIQSLSADGKISRRQWSPKVRFVMK
jgi:hypothetical protein